MTWLDFVALVLAVGAPINAWLLDQGVFSNRRERIIAWGEWDGEGDGDMRRWDRIKARIAEGVQCRLCLHYHWPYLLLVLYGASLFYQPPWSTLWKFPVYSLAATRLSYQLSQLWSEDEHDRGKSEPGSES